MVAFVPEQIGEVALMVLFEIKLFNVTGNGSEVFEQPLTETVTVNEPAEETEIDGVIAPVLHKLPEEDEDVKSKVLPEHITDPGALMVGTGMSAPTLNMAVLELFVSPGIAHLALKYVPLSVKVVVKERAGLVSPGRLFQLVPLFVLFCH